MIVYELAACPVCGSRDFRQVTDAEGIRRELETLWQFHTRRLAPGAPIQQFFDRAIFSQAPPWQIVQCRGCSLLLRNPRESVRSLLDVYAGEEPPRDALESLFAEQQQFYRRRLESLPGRSVLEVGSYLGAFLKAAQEQRWYAEGIDVNRSAVRFAAEKGCQVSESELSDYSAERSFDVVAFWNCFEQLPDPRAALLRAHELLAPEGTLVLRVPNGACYRRFRGRPAGTALLAHNNLLSFPYRHGFTPAALRALVSDVGFRDIRVRGDTLVSISGPWTRRWARLEERALKLLLRGALPTAVAPWLELYARI